MIVLACGSRGWTDPEPIRARLFTLPTNAVVLHGDAQGADRIAGKVARARGLHVAAMAALWDYYGRGAGYRRNAAMLTLRPHVVLAFWDGQSPGTRMMVNLAHDAGVPVEVIQPTS